MIFSKIDVNKVEWLNLVFENRNQSYGAYVLRRDSGNYLLISLLITGLFFGSTVLFSTIINNDKSKDSRVNVVSVDNSDEVHIIPIETAKPTPELIKAEVVPPASLGKTDLQTVKFAGNLNPVKDELVVTDAPTIKQIEESVIALQTSEGLKAGIESNGSSSKGEGMEGIGEGTSSGTEIYSTSFLEAMPEFPGGMKAWANFLTKNLNYPSMAAENGISGRVLVSFVVEKNGEISNLKVIKGIGGGCDEEAMRVIKKSPAWKPGMQNGRAVRVAYMMPVVFRME